MEDTIRRSDAVDAIECITWYHQNKNKDMVSGANSDEHQAWYKAEDVYKALEGVPSADRPQGEWIPSDTDGFVCSVCKNGYRNQPTLMGRPMFEYCPVCGTRMKGADDGKDIQSEAE